MSRRLSWERKKLVYDQLGVTFFPPQRAVLENADDVVLMFAGGIGCGKSMIAALNLLPECLIGGRRFWLVGPDYDQARSEFNWLLKFLWALTLDGKPIEFAKPPSMPLEGDWSCALGNGTLIETKSARRPDSMHSVAIDGIIGCEAGQLPEQIVINRMLPRITRTKGDTGWMYLGGTFEGGNTFMARSFMAALAGEMPGWSAYSMATWENTVDFPGGMENPKITFMKRVMTEEEFMQRYGAVPMSPQGVVMKEFSSSHHVTEEAEYDPELPVQLWVDPGRTYACLAVQIWPDDSVVAIIDEVYLQDGTSERCITEAVMRPWWRSVSHGYIDIAMPEQCSIWQSGSIWRELSLRHDLHLTGMNMYTQRVGIEAGIERVRQLLHCKVFSEDTKRPIWQYNGQDGISRILIHPRCQRTIGEMGLYQYGKDRVLDGNLPQDKFNHSMKALAYGCVGNFGFIQEQAYQYTNQSPIQRATVGETVRYG